MSVLGNYVELVTNGTALGRPSKNIFRYMKSSGPAGGTKAAFATAFKTAVGDVITAAMDSAYGISSYTIRNFDNATDLAEIQSFTPETGGVTSDDPKIHSAVCIHLYSDQRGKRYQGRKHFGPPAEGQDEDGVLTGGGITQWAAVRDACLLPITETDTGTTYVPCIVSGPPLSQLEVNPTTVFALQVLTARLNLTLGTMRRRRLATTF